MTDRRDPDADAPYLDARRAEPYTLDDLIRIMLAHDLHDAVADLALSEGVATAEDIDKAMKLGANHPRGPFEWAEEIGVQSILRMLDSLRDAYGEAYIAAPSLRAAGRSGA